jgi:hypothetical protein
VIQTRGLKDELWGQRHEEDAILCDPAVIVNLRILNGANKRKNTQSKP